MGPADCLQEALTRLGLARRLTWREVDRLLELAEGDLAQVQGKPRADWTAKFEPLTDAEYARMADIYDRLGQVITGLMAEEAPLWARPHAKGRIQKVIERLQIPEGTVLRIPLRGGRP